MKSIIAIGIERPESDLVFRLKQDSRFRFEHFGSLDDIRLEKLGGCDALLVTLHQKLTSQILRGMPRLRYIGVYGSNTTNIDLDYCASRNILVTNVTEYSDNETANFVVRQVQENAKDDSSIGIIGLGHVGLMLAKKLVDGGYPTHYASRTRKKGVESELGIQYAEDTKNLIQTCDVICICVSPKVMAIHQSDLDAIQLSKLIINVSLGPNFDVGMMDGFLDRTNSKIVLDKIAQKKLDLSKVGAGWVLAEEFAWKSAESQRILDEKFLANLDVF